jgi:hypothetical protein
VECHSIQFWVAGEKPAFEFICVHHSLFSSFAFLSAFNDIDEKS